MNALLKLTISLVFLILTACVHHSGHYSDRYDYNRGYDSYYSYPVYYERDVYVHPPVRDHRRDSYKGQHERHYNAPNKHQKPNHRHNNYKQPGKHSKHNKNRPFSQNKHENKAKKYVKKAQPFRGYSQKHSNTDSNDRFANHEEEQSDHNNYSTNSESSNSQSKHLKSNKSNSPQRSHAGKGFKR